jgi:hypothetical protein
MRLRVMTATLLCACLVFPLMSWSEQDQDDDQEFREALENLGSSAGYAMQCVGEDKTKTSMIGSQADLIGGGLLKEFGSQFAFRFMVYFGIGIAESIDKSKCADYLADWNKFTAKYSGMPQLN